MSDHGFVRELELTEALSIGLGTMIGAGIFVLSATAAHRAGPAAMFSYILAGLICFPIALTISELATGMPQAGGSYHLISRTLGPLAGTVVGVGNWLGLVFATGFYLIGFAQYVAYFIAVPLWLTVILTGVGFIILNYRGSKLSGRVQNYIVIALVTILAYFVIRGFFHQVPALHADFFPHGWSAVLTNVGLIIVSFTGFEKISTIAEEIKQPGRNLPLAIVGSVIIATLIYASVLFVVTGILPYQGITAFQAPLVEAATRFMGTVGVLGVSIAALLATASSANAAIMASSRINFAMGRDDILPHWFNAIHPHHLTPYRSIIVTGSLAILLALSGRATELAEISSALFMVSYALLTLGLLVMRRTKPSWYRPAFRVPLAPWLPLAGGLAALAVIGTMDITSQIAGLGLATLSLLWYAFWGRRRTEVKGELQPWLARERPLEAVMADFAQSREAQRSTVLVPIANPATVRGLIEFSAELTRGYPDAKTVALKVVPVPLNLPLSIAQTYLEEERDQYQDILQQAEKFGRDAGVTLIPSLEAAHGIDSGIVGAAKRLGARLILMGWHGELAMQKIRASVDKAVVQAAPCDVAVLLDRHKPLRRILVPSGGGPHARLGIRLARDLITSNPQRSVVVLRVVPKDEKVDLAVEETAAMRLVHDELGDPPAQVKAKVVQAATVREGILQEAQRGYDLLIIGASEEWFLHNWLFGAIPDIVANHVTCSVLLVRKAEPAPISWLRRLTRGLGKRPPSA